MISTRSKGELETKEMSKVSDVTFGGRHRVGGQRSFELPETKKFVKGYEVEKVMADKVMERARVWERTLAACTLNLHRWRGRFTEIRNKQWNKVQRK